MRAIEISGLTYVYSKRTPFEKIALDNVNLSVEEGEFVAVVGMTGSGKSTLVQHLNGLIKPETGTVNILGVSASDKKKLRELRSLVGMVFQYPEYQLFEDTVAKDIAFGPKNMKLAPEEIDKRVRKSMELVGLPYSEFAERSPFELSGGEKRRAAIAGVIAMEPKILVLDEPFAGLDPVGVKEITALILKLKSEISPTVVLVSHNMDAVASLADRVVALKDGKVLADASPKAVFGDRGLVKEIGLDLPFAAYFCDKLIENGINISTQIVTERELVEALDALKKRENCTPDGGDGGGDDV